MILVVRILSISCARAVCNGVRTALPGRGVGLRIPRIRNRIDYVNTEACEQLFSWLGKFKFQTAGMTISTYKYFLYMVILLHNEQILNP